MIPLLKGLFHSLLYDELALTRWLRGAMLTFAAGGIAFADQLAEVVALPRGGRWIKAVAIVCGFVGGAITAGQKNAPAPVEAPKP